MDQFVILGVSLALNTVIGIAMYFMKVTHDAQKDRIDKLEIEIGKVRDTSFKREDFHDFRDQLWSRLDKMEADFKSQLIEFKK